MEDEEEPEGEDLNSEDVRLVYPIVYTLLLILKMKIFWSANCPWTVFLHADFLGLSGG